MKSAVIAMLVTFLFPLVPAMGQPKAESVPTPAAVCAQMEGGKNLVWSQDGQGRLQKTNVLILVL